MDHDQKTEAVDEIEAVSEIEEALFDYGGLSTNRAIHIANRLVDAGYTGWGHVRRVANQGHDFSQDVPGIGGARNNEIHIAVVGESVEMAKEAESKEEAEALKEVADTLREGLIARGELAETEMRYHRALSVIGKLLLEPEPLFTLDETSEITLGVDYIANRQANVPESIDA